MENKGRLEWQKSTNTSSSSSTSLLLIFRASEAYILQCFYPDTDNIISSSYQIFIQHPLSTGTWLDFVHNFIGKRDQEKRCMILDLKNCITYLPLVMEITWF